MIPTFSRKQYAWTVYNTRRGGNVLFPQVTGYHATRDKALRAAEQDMARARREATK